MVAHLQIFQPLAWRPVGVQLRDLACLTGSVSAGSDAFVCQRLLHSSIGTRSFGSTDPCFAAFADDCRATFESEFAIPAVVRIAELYL